MGNSTRTENEPGAQRSPSIAAGGGCALIVGAPVSGVHGLADGLKPLGLAVRESRAPEQTRDILFDERVVLVVVYFGRDVPGGIAACRSIRKHPSGQRVPILAVLDEKAVSDFPVDCGVDEALIAPFTPEEVTLRARLMLWRLDVADSPEVVKMGPVSINMPGMWVRVNGVSVDLTYKEFALLRYFLENPGRALQRIQILEAVWGEDYYGGDRTVDIHVRRLRAKLAPIAGCVETIHGVGYRFVAADLA